MSFGLAAWSLAVSVRELLWFVPLFLLSAQDRWFYLTCQLLLWSSGTALGLWESESLRSSTLWCFPFPTLHHGVVRFGCGGLLACLGAARRISHCCRHDSFPILIRRVFARPGMHGRVPRIVTMLLAPPTGALLVSLCVGDLTRGLPQGDWFAKLNFTLTIWIVLFRAPNRSSEMGVTGHSWFCPFFSWAKLLTVAPDTVGTCKNLLPAPTTSSSVSTHYSWKVLL